VDDRQFGNITKLEEKNPHGASQARAAA